MPVVLLRDACRASNNLTHATALGASEGCMSACRGQPTQSCGGPQALRVFTLPDFTQLGCFADTWQRRLPHLLQTSGRMSAAKCARLAAEAGYTVFGIQDSKQCWCVLGAAAVLGCMCVCTAGPDMLAHSAEEEKDCSVSAAH